jgi:hypothetical protein
MTWEQPPPVPQLSRRAVLVLLGAAPLAAGGVFAASRTAYADSGFAARVQEIIGRSVFQGPDEA